MVRVSARSKAGVPAIVLAALVAAAAAASFAACSDPGAFLSAVNTEAKKSLDMFLVVTSVTPAKGSTEVNPSSAIKIDFDRPLDETTVTTQNISIAPSAGGDAVGWSYDYDAALKRLSLKPGGLAGGEEYIVSIGTGLKSAKGEPLQDSMAWSLSTANLPGGSMWINVTSDPADSEIQAATYTKSRAVTLTFSGNALVDSYVYSETVEGLETAMTPILPPWPVISMNLTQLEGPCTVYARFKNLASGNFSDIISDTIILDLTPPIHPSVPVADAASLATHAPSWTWSSGGGGNGTFPYRLAPSGGGADVASGNATQAGCVPSGIKDGDYILYVKELDDAGNESAEVHSAVATIDGPPNPPTVSCTTPTLDTTPAFSWTHDGSYGFGTGAFRYQIDSTTGIWISTSATGLAPSLEDGSHTLYVQETDGSQWSPSGSRTVVVSPVIPYDGQTKVDAIGTRFTWRDVAASYTLEIKQGARGTWTEVASGLTLPGYELEKDLEKGTTYTWRVSYPILLEKGRIGYLPSSTGATFTTAGFIKF
jgi:hypothetical protein